MAGTCSNELTDNGRPDYDFMIKSHYAGTSALAA